MVWMGLGVTPAVAAEQLKVVIIVGPTGAQTDSYRSTGNSIANVAEDAGANVVKVYSPRATWSRVRNAVAGANIVVYLGHGNGYPNPYSSGTEWTDRANGWGLNRTTEGGDSDDWSRKMVYCGEKALLGTLTASDGSAQWNYCGGKKGTDGIAPAADWVMIYNKACYAPGASEGWDAKATESQAFQRVRNYSYPALKNDGGAYFATDMYLGAQQLVDTVLRHRDWTFGAIAEAANGFEMSAQRRFDHPDLTGREVWLQRTNTSMGLDYWYAYAGNPNLTPSGEMGVYVPPPAPEVSASSPAANEVDVTADTNVRVTFDQPVTGLSADTFKLADVYGLRVPGSLTYNSSTYTARFTPNVPLESGMRYKVSPDPRHPERPGCAHGRDLAGASTWRARWARQPPATIRRPSWSWGQAPTPATSSPFAARWSPPSTPRWPMSAPSAPRCAGQSRTRRAPGSTSPAAPGRATGCVNRAPLAFPAARSVARPNRRPSTPLAPSSSARARTPATPSTRPAP